MIGGVARRSVLVGLSAAWACSARAAASEKIEVVCFPGAGSLPILVARKLGFFDDHGVDVSITFTPNSLQLREGLVNGRYHIAHAAVDNAVAIDVAGAAKIAVVVGGDNGFNRLYAQKGIKDISSLRGRTVTVDAPNTAFALQLYKMLQLAGLSRTDYAVKPIGATDLRLDAMLADREQAASMLSLGAAVRAEAAGLVDLGSAVGALGPYLGGCGFVVREPTRINADRLARYLAGYVQGVRWVLDHDNRAAAIAGLSEAYKLPASLAPVVWSMLVDPTEGLKRDAAIDLDGFRTVLALRAAFEGQWNGNPPDPSQFIDDGPYRAALRRL